jgi:hypothetical protein
MTRTVSKFMRVYAGGYDISGNTRSIGPLTWAFEEESMTCLNWPVAGTLPGKATMGCGTLNGLFDNTATTGLHILQSSSGVTRDVMIPIGMSAAPTYNDPVYMGQFPQTGYMAEPGEIMSTVSITFSSNDVTKGLKYSKPWGVLLHPLGAETAANTNETNVHNNGAGTTAGGYLMYQITAVAGTGSATISIDDSEDGETYGALSGATSGAIAHTSIPCAGIVQLATTATVKQYLRFQVALDTITSVTFALAFVRG